MIITIQINSIKEMDQVLKAAQHLRDVAAECYGDAEYLKVQESAEKAPDCCLNCRNCVRNKVTKEPVIINTWLTCRRHGINVKSYSCCDEHRRPG